MRKRIVILFAVVLMLGLVAVSFAGLKSMMELKAGDEIYACNCGEKCPCNTMSRNAGKCTCGTEMIKAKVTKVEEGKAYLQAAGWEKERSFKTKGQYACACGENCKCDTISQNPGKCTCGVEMQKVN